ncbi:hypothetical protein D3791_11550 [Glutamicibacter mishrai]|uniref:Uncharacterized protein n=1 Tax=Glutamicibacter mishrai TaxID=1775880 RepID=A0A6H0SKM2_9MICC|nr:hypothetical protein D3791_11550 [Glutamicibacter mishrai]
MLSDKCDIIVLKVGNFSTNGTAVRLEQLFERTKESSHVVHQLVYVRTFTDYIVHSGEPLVFGTYSRERTRPP